MNSKLEMKVGLFALFALVIIGVVIIQVSDRGGVASRGYEVTVVLESAEGLIRKTAVEVAGIQVGSIVKLDLIQGNKARAVLRIDRRVRLGKDTVARVRTKGFLGETYIDLTPGHPEKGEIPPGGEIQATNPFVDLGQITSDAQDFIGRLRDLAEKNEENINRILESLAQFSSDLREVMSENKESLSETMERVSSVSRKVDEGRGTLGRLVNDEQIAESIHEAAQGVSETVGGINRFQFAVGYHLEYLGHTREYKNYVDLRLKPRPDKFFILEFVMDPSPSPNRTITTEDVTTGGVTTRTVTDAEVQARNSFRVSAQLAKQFYDFTFRGGIIEHRGGIGLDWHHGPFGVEFSAFDFRTDTNRAPHLKALASLNIVRSVYLVSGVDDIISKEQDPDWFIGAGFRFIDDDIKSLFTAAAIGASSSGR